MTKKNYILNKFPKIPGVKYPQFERLKVNKSTVSDVSITISVKNIQKSLQKSVPSNILKQKKIMIELF